MGADFLREMNWLGVARVRGYLRLLALLNAAMLVWLLVGSHGGVDANGFLLGSDFISFWTTGRMLIAHGDPYDAAAHIAAQRGWFASPTGYTAFFYPPSFLPFCWPLGWLGYFPALAAWLLATGVLYCAAVRVWWHGLDARLSVWLPLAAFPAMPIVVTHGQTSWLVAALLGTGVVMIRRQPLLAGLCLGLATVKPQFGLLVPLALLASREWRVFLFAGLAALALAVLSALAFGPELWVHWLGASTRAQVAMADGAVGFGKMVSPFAALRLLGVSTVGAYAAQGAITAVVAALVVVAGWGRRWGTGLAALVLAGAPLATPFVLDYDMVLLAFPMVWLVGEGLRGGFAPYEKLALLLAFAAPAFARPLAMNLSVPIMPLVLLAFFAVIWRRATSAAHVHAHAHCGEEPEPEGA
ncbi:glycosyltransferase family 87 protein [Novosphingobium sp. BL-8H]|uniref:glycosyltransferase family 87 protein n=1 Tax=Novosphingobium sp. BL-8H TaxID=3127640 RepID=UPI0037570827